MSIGASFLGGAKSRLLPPSIPFRFFSAAAVFHVFMWLGLLVGNLFSSMLMTFVTMPYYVNPLLKHWLRPPPNVPAAKANWRGIGISVAALAFWTLVFYLVTRVFWHLP